MALVEIEVDEKLLEALRYADGGYPKSIFHLFHIPRKNNGDRRKSWRNFVLGRTFKVDENILRGCLQQAAASHKQIATYRPQVKVRGITAFDERADDAQVRESYEERNAIVRQLGFRNYRDYLNGDLWARIRGGVLNRAKFKCSCCGNEANQVHHQKYTRENLSGASIKFMVAICGTCHNGIEFGGKGKATVDLASRRLDLVKA